MCGIAGICGGHGGTAELRAQLDAMAQSQHHRGPDARGVWVSDDGAAGLAHNRLSIIDLSDAGRQPLASADGRYQIVFNGEIYNYLELRAALAGDYPFRTRTDTEVLLAAFARWGERCLDKLIGMFAFAIWDTRERRLFAARDRFGVKPFAYHLHPDGALWFASEIKALHAAGVAREPDPVTWATYLARGLYEHSARTFWRGIVNLPAGHALTWSADGLRIARWYDLAEHVPAEVDTRGDGDVAAEYRALLEESVKLRFRADVPVGINISGGLDSSTLLGLVHAVQGPESDVKAFTFVTGDPHYDETPWVERMLARTRHEAVACLLQAEDVPRLAADVARYEDEPYGGLPTLAYARIFEEARARGVIVLLDGQGLDEQWAGYDYYVTTPPGAAASVVQGTRESPTRPECLDPEFVQLAEAFTPPAPFPDRLRNLQYRDAHCTKIPRALRFNDRVSMRASTELREPFLDHRLFELAFRQPPERKIRGDVRKYLLRRITAALIPHDVVEAPKRPLQTPQREWLRGPLRHWAHGLIEQTVTGAASQWFDAQQVRARWTRYCAGEGDNSFWVWQWLSLSLPGAG